MPVGEVFVDVRNYEWDLTKPVGWWNLSFVCVRM